MSSVVYSTDGMEDFLPNVRIQIFGLGGGGCNVITQMLECPISNVEYYAVNTDALALKHFPNRNRILIGEDITKGYGAGMDMELGKRAASISANLVSEKMMHCEIIIIIAGLGGGTGSGGLPVLVKLAKEANALTIVFATMPFPFEGKKRMQNAKKSVDEFIQLADSRILIANKQLLAILGEYPIKQAFTMTNKIIIQGVQALYELIHTPVFINVDYADIKVTLEKQGNAFIGVGRGAGKRKCSDAVNDALNSVLLEKSIHGLSHGIVHISGEETLTLEEVQDTIMLINKKAGNDMDIIFGMCINSQLHDEVIVTIIAAGQNTNS